MFTKYKSFKIRKKYLEKYCPNIFHHCTTNKRYGKLIINEDYKIHKLGESILRLIEKSPAFTA